MKRQSSSPVLSKLGTDAVAHLRRASSCEAAAGLAMRDGKTELYERLTMEARQAWSQYRAALERGAV